MSVLSREELLSRLRERIGDDTSDEALQYIEDVTDTFTDFETRTKDSTNWKEKYTQNDQAWREKYKARFFSNTEDTEVEETDTDNYKKLTFENLFKEE